MWIQLQNKLVKSDYQRLLSISPKFKLTTLIENAVGEPLIMFFSGKLYNNYENNSN